MYDKGKQKGSGVNWYVAAFIAFLFLLEIVMFIMEVSKPDLIP